MGILEKLQEDIIKVMDGWLGDSIYESPEVFPAVAKKAIDSLGILILDKDAEPEVGDVVEYREYGSTNKRYGVFEESAPMESVKIIKRGNQLVIQE